MSDPNPASEDIEEEQLNKAIEELRGVLHEGKEENATTQAGGSATRNAAIIMDIPVEVQIILGRAEMSVSELMELQKGSTIALDRRIGEPVDVIVNGRRIARGEVTVLDHDTSRFGIRLTEVAGTENETAD